MKSNQRYPLLTCLLFFAFAVTAQNNKLIQKIEQTMLHATQYMVDSVSYNGGFVWHYLPDKSRQWGEMEAYKTMIWMQHPGTLSMGQLFLDAYNITGNEYYYQAAQKTAAAVIWGQSHEGGWNYMIDFAGDKSLKKWYATIGKNGWRLEEFQHYYGNATFDDDVTVDAARFLLRLYLQKLDPSYKPALDKAINFILISQYPMGGWPQRYPLRYDFSNHGHADYSSYYTFNDDVIGENIQFLIDCYLTLGEERFLDPIMRGMNFYILSQDGCGAWGQQLTMDCVTASARTYELKAFLPSTTFENAMFLIRFYRYTGDKRFLSRVPAAIDWLEKTKLQPHKTQDGRYTHPTFIDVDTGKALYVHRKGSNTKNGTYYANEDENDLLAHYYGKCRVSVDILREEYSHALSTPIDELLQESPLTSAEFKHKTTPQKFYNTGKRYNSETPNDDTVKSIINSLDKENRWLIKHAMTSNRYIGDGTLSDQTTQYATTLAGDSSDTSPYIDNSEQLYISTSAYIKNMRLLLNYIKATKQSPSK